MSLIDMQRQARPLTGLNKPEFEDLAEVLRERNVQLYSRDYATLYVPLTGAVEVKEGETADSFTMNKTYSFDTFFEQMVGDRARLVIVPNPALSEFFKDIEHSNYLEQGEALFLKAKARKNASYDDVVEACPWLFRCFALDYR